MALDADNVALDIYNVAVEVFCGPPKLDLRISIPPLFLTIPIVQFDFL
jgi:hypothetical protein